jgi:hypothetical protein
MAISSVATLLLAVSVPPLLATILCWIVRGLRPRDRYSRFVVGTLAAISITGTLGALYIEAVRGLHLVDTRCGFRLAHVVKDCLTPRHCPCSLSSPSHDSTKCPADCPETLPAPRILWTYLDKGRPWSSKNVWVRAAWRSWQIHAKTNEFVIKTLNSSEALVANVRYPIPEWVATLPYNHQGDLISFALLLEHGGLYLDSDLLLVSNPDQFLQHTRRQEFVAFHHVTLSGSVHSYF